MLPTPFFEPYPTWLESADRCGNVSLFKYVTPNEDPLRFTMRGLERAAGLAKKVRPFSIEYPKRGMGHHFGPRRAGLPRSYSESVFNRLKPEGITRGDMNELHYKVDPKFKGTGFPARVGGGKWSGADLGLKEYGLAGRIWHGSPALLKARVGGLEAASVRLPTE